MPERNKLGRFLKGIIPWNKGKKGLQIHSKETRLKMSKSHKNHPCYKSKIRNEKIRLSKLGKKRPDLALRNKSEENRMRMSKLRKGKKLPLKIRMNMSLAQTKEKVFTGFKKPLSRRLQVSTRWKQWRMAVFERDDYTCQDCRVRGCYLEPHHIVPVKECLLIDYEELIFDVNNGMTLCKPCHLGKGIHRGTKE